jgi:hypothetical protein
VIETSFSAFPFGFFPENVGVFSDEHGENSITTFPKWKRGRATVENEAQIFWLTAGGVL